MKKYDYYNSNPNMEKLSLKEKKISEEYQRKIKEQKEQLKALSYYLERKKIKKENLLTSIFASGFFSNPSYSSSWSSMLSSGLLMIKPELVNISSSLFINSLSL